MKTIHITKCRDAIVVNHSNNTIETIEPIRTDIDWVYISPDDCEIKYKMKNGEYKTLSVEKGDIIVKFYEYDYTVNPIVVVKNNKWKENLAKKDVHEQKAVLDKALNAFSKNKPCDCCDCCDCCEGC